MLYALSPLQLRSKTCQFKPLPSRFRYQGSRWTFRIPAASFIFRPDFSSSLSICLASGTSAQVVPWIAVGLCVQLKIEHVLKYFVQQMQNYCLFYAAVCKLLSESLSLWVSTCFIQTFKNIYVVTLMSIIPLICLMPEMYGNAFLSWP